MTTAKPLRIVAIDAHDIAGQKPGAAQGIAASNLREEKAARLLSISIETTTQHFHLRKKLATGTDRSRLLLE